jgi:hypothetical protein
MIDTKTDLATIRFRAPLAIVWAADRLEAELNRLRAERPSSGLLESALNGAQLEIARLREENERLRDEREVT